eukprot:COSAG06_NODE_60846_length_269_cov_1.176471_1_plen_23_part_01
MPLARGKSCRFSVSGGMRGEALR